MRMIDPILTELDQEAATTRRLLERVPQSQLGCSHMQNHAPSVNSRTTSPSRRVELPARFKRLPTTSAPERRQPPTPSKASSRTSTPARPRRSGCSQA